MEQDKCIAGFNVVDLLGKGSYGMVIHVRESYGQRRPFALKVMHGPSEEVDKEVRLASVIFYMTP